MQRSGAGDPRHAEPTDEALAARVAERDVAAFELLYDRYVRLVYALAARSLGAAEAQDIVQEVFLQLWRTASQFDPERGRFAAWFTVIARHRVLAQLGARGRQQRFAVADAFETALARAPDPGPSIEESAERSEAAETALRALKSLPPEQRRVLALAYFAGMSQTTIARHLDIPLGTVKKRVRLGMQKIRATLACSGELSASDMDRTISVAAGTSGEKT